MTNLINEQIKQATFIKAPAATIYDVITTGAGWDAFFTHGAEVNPRPGGHIMFRWKNWGPEFYTGSDGGPVLEADPPRRFVFQWGVKYRSTITFDLTEEHGGTTVRLTDRGHPDTPEGRARILECAAGWGEALTLLKFYIEHGIVYTPPQK